MKKFIVLTVVVLVLVAICGQAMAVNIVVTAESGEIVDTSDADGVQAISVGGAVSVDDRPENAAIGDRSLSFSEMVDVLSFLEFEGTSGTALGAEFTLAAAIEPNDLSRGLRVFSNYAGSGGIGAGRVLFDCYGNGAVKTMRFNIGGSYDNSQSITFTSGVYHHLAVTYNHGESKLYVNGSQVGPAVTGGPDTPDLPLNLRFGEDQDERIPPIVNEPLIGHADEIVIVSRVLSDAEIADLSINGYPDTAPVNVTTSPDDEILASALSFPTGVTDIPFDSQITLAAESIVVDVNEVDLSTSLEYTFQSWEIDGQSYATPEVTITVNAAVEAQAVYTKALATLYDVSIAIEGAGNDPNLTEPDPGTFTVVKNATDVVTVSAVPVKITCPGILDFIQWEANGEVVATTYETDILIEDNTTLTAVYESRTLLGSCGTISIPVINGDFEDPQVPGGTSGHGNVPGWTVDDGDLIWIENRKYVGSYADVSQTVLIGRRHEWPSGRGQMSQVLAAGVSPNTEYSVSADLINTNYPGLENSDWITTDWEIRLETLDGEILAQMSDETHGYAPLDENGLGYSTPYPVISTGVTGLGDRDSRVGKQMRVVAITNNYLCLMDNIEVSATGQLFELTIDADPNYVDITPAIGSYTFIEGTTVTLATDKGTLDCPDFLVFDQWVGDEVVDPFSASTEVVVDGNKSVTATYALAGTTEQLQLHLLNADMDETAIPEGTSEYIGWGVPAGGRWQPNIATGEDYCGISNEVDSYFDNPSPNSGGQFGVMITGGTETLEVYQIIETIFCDGQTYTVSADIGWPNDESWQFTEYSIRLVSAKTGQVIAEATQENQTPALPDPNDWITVTASGVAGPAVDGDKIKVIIGGYNSDAMAFDSIRVSGPSVLVSLTMSADPEVAADAVSPAGQTAFSFPSMVAIDAEDAVDCPDRLVFAEWTGDVVDPDSASTLVKMDEDKALVALYDRQEGYYDVCGDICHPYPSSDLTEDCVVDLYDFGALSQIWLTGVKIPISVANWSFEEPDVANDSTAGYGVHPGWVGSGGNIYVENRQWLFTDSGTFNPVDPTRPQMLTIEIAGENASQVLDHTIMANTNYSIELDIGDTGYWSFSTFKAQLVAADTGEVIAEANETNSTLPAENSFIHVAASGTTGDGSDPRVGQALKVVLTNAPGGGILVWDNVRVEYVDDDTLIGFDQLLLLAEYWLTDNRP